MITPMSLQIAVAMIEQQGRWLLQLRDDIEGIVHPGTWGLFGGHLDPGEMPEQALRRELEEEISWVAGEVRWWFNHQDPHRILHVFHVPLPVSLEVLELREGQDMVLAELDELRSGAIWSPKRRQSRTLAPSLRLALERLETQGLPDPSANQHA
jgi:8-oxo-dGTP diphosphatase